MSRLRTIVPAGCAVVVILAIILSVGAFVWPGFLRSPPAPPPPTTMRYDDPMALLPSDTNWLVGADLVRARKQGILEPILAYLTNPPKGMPTIPGEPLPAGLAEVLRDGESVMLAGIAGGEPARPVMILTTQGPIDVEKVKKACHATENQPVHGHVVYDADPWQKDGRSLLAFPGERMMLFSTREFPHFVKVLAPGPRPAHPSLDLIQEARQGTIWAVLQIDERSKGSIKKTLPEALAALVPPLQEARGMILKLSVPAGASSVDARLDAVCFKDVDAAAIAEAGQSAWKQSAFLRLAARAFVKDAGIASMLGDFDNMKISAAGSRASANVQFSEKTLQLLQGQKK
jgi:hypothetical protein